MPIDSAKLPEKWTPLIKRLAGMADRECGNNGFAIMTVRVLVSPKGEPVMWVEPHFDKLEPRLGAFQFMTKLLEQMGANPLEAENSVDNS